LTVAFNDIFAYFGGKNFGRHLLAPAISPKKTIEGAGFGFLGGIFGAYAALYLFDVFSAVFDVGPASRSLIELLSLGNIILIVLIVVPISQIGDLVESKFKRFCGVKDSSNFIPGHGGLLDRCDAFLLAIPAFYIALLFIGIQSI
jgi:phosphatidate cytidylyltransferase